MTTSKGVEHIVTNVYSHNINMARSKACKVLKVQNMIYIQIITQEQSRETINIRRKREGLKELGVGKMKSLIS